MSCSVSCITEYMRFSALTFNISLSDLKIFKTKEFMGKCVRRRNNQKLHRAKRWKRTIVYCNLCDGISHCPGHWQTVICKVDIIYRSFCTILRFNLLNLLKLANICANAMNVRLQTDYCLVYYHFNWLFKYSCKYATEFYTAYKCFIIIFCSPRIRPSLARSGPHPFLCVPTSLYSPYFLVNFQGLHKFYKYIYVLLMQVTALLDEVTTWRMRGLFVEIL